MAREIASRGKMYSGGQITVPACAQQRQELCYEKEVRVEIMTPDAPTESVTFTSYVTSGATVTVPKGVRQMVNLEDGDEITATFEATGNELEYPNELRGWSDYEKEPGELIDNRTITHSEDSPETPYESADEVKMELFG